MPHRRKRVENEEVRHCDPIEHAGCYHSAGSVGAMRKSMRVSSHLISPCYDEVNYKVYHAGERPDESVWNWLSWSSVVSLEWAGPGVGGGIIFPFSVSVSLALEFLLSDVLIGVLVGGFLLDGGGWSSGNEGEDSGEFHFALLKICYKNLLNITFYSVNYIKSIDFEYSQFIC